MRSRRTDAGRVVDAVRLAVAGVRDAHDLGAALQQVCVGAARITGGTTVLLALERASQVHVAAFVGRVRPDQAEILIAELAVSGSLDGRVLAGDPMIVPISGEVANGSVVVRGARAETLSTLELFVEVAGLSIDLQAMRGEAAAAAHRVQPAEQVGGVIASVRQGDGVVIVALDALDDVRARFGDDAVDSLVSAASVLLLNATRPPGDVIAGMSDGQFLVVLRDLKAPVEIVAQRLLDTWQATRPTTTVSLGAALHLDGLPPLDTIQRAEAALQSATRLGGGQAHIAPSLGSTER